MRKVAISDSVKFENSPVCFGYEASFEDAPMNGALITVSGRYPDTGYVMNEVCSELAFVVRGSGKVCTATETIEFGLHDTVLLQPGEKFYWQGDFDIYTVCTPAFYPEQHKEVS